MPTLRTLESEKKISYTLKKSKRAKRMRLSVHHDGSVIVTIPFGFRETMVEKFVREKSQWLLAKIAFFAQYKERVFVRHNKKNYLQYKDRARQLVVARIHHFNKEYVYNFSSIKIRNQKTRWGSCSRKGNLSFNYKIALLPERLADYIIVHELCHLKEFNHSRNFWNLVGEQIPNYAEMRNELKKNGNTFF